MAQFQRIKILRSLLVATGAWSIIQNKSEKQLLCQTQKLGAKPPIVIQHKKSSKYSYRRLCRIVKRLVEVAARLLPVLVSYLLKTTPIGETKEQWLKRLVDTLANLGPVGIKWGQWASTRYDLFDDEICEALGELTNCAPVHSYHITKEIIEKSFGKSLGELFTEFESVAIASGSIAQVHIAKLGSKKVAVKVQHPNLSERLDIDMEVLRWVADWAGNRIGQTVDQFSCNFQAQLDFRDEASNLNTFNEKFNGMFWSSLVSFPKPIEGLISEHVLVETFEEGESVAHFLGRIEEDMNDMKNEEDTDINFKKNENKNKNHGKHENIEDENDDNMNKEKTEKMMLLKEQKRKDLLIRNQVAQCGMQAFLKMLIWDNFIHADLHPGNVIIRLVEVGPMVRFVRWALLGDSDPLVPHIVLLDAGLAASFQEKIGGQVHSFFKAIANRDSEAVARTIITLGAKDSPPLENPEEFVKEVSKKFDLQFDDFEKGGKGRSADNISSIMKSVRDHNIIVDSAVMIGLMSMVVLEGWQYRLAPNVSVLNSIESAMGKSPFGMINNSREFLTNFLDKIQSSE